MLWLSALQLSSRSVVNSLSLPNKGALCFCSVSIACLVCCISWGAPHKKLSLAKNSSMHLRLFLTSNWSACLASVHFTGCCGNRGHFFFFLQHNQISPPPSPFPTFFGTAHTHTHHACSSVCGCSPGSHFFPLWERNCCGGENSF